MISLITHNGSSFPIREVPVLTGNEFHETVREGLSLGFRMLCLTPFNPGAPEVLTAVLADDSSSSLHIVSGTFPKENLSFESFAGEHPQTNYFECELSEMHGYIPRWHPWLRPVRKQKTILGGTPYHFYKMEGDEVHEVAVGPVHAGVIEPGHFRFQCHGEAVYHLEINLGYQHRGIEALMKTTKPSARIALAESIAGDTVIGHTYAHCAAVESLCGTAVPLRAQIIRSIAEEAERAAMHLTGLTGIANDIGLAIAAASYGRLRTLIINGSAALCGSRFGRGLFRYGGIRFDITDEIRNRLLRDFTTVRRHAAAIHEFLFSSGSALARFEQTGTVSREAAEKIGLVGMTARSCGIELDTRVQYPYGAYHYYPASMLTLQTGDVYARARIRSFELEESLRFIIEQLAVLPEAAAEQPAPPMQPSSGVVSITEGWRGEIVHVLITYSTGTLLNYKIKDPSFNNWYGLGLALRGTAISDFPLCNKSFDLSYAGHDL